MSERKKDASRIERGKGHSQSSPTSNRVRANQRMNSLEILSYVLGVTSRRSEDSSWSEEGFPDVRGRESGEELLESRGESVVGFVGASPYLKIR